MTALPAFNPRPLAIVWNPVAGRRRRRRLAAILAALEAAGVAFDLHQTAGPGHASEIARRLAGTADRYRAIVAAGGDGTINEVVNGMVGGALPLGLIPLGTANVLALELGLPATAAGIAAVLVTGRTRPVDLGLAQSAQGARHFIVMAGVGYDAHVVAGVSPRWKRRLGKLAYVGEMLRQLRHFHFAPYRLRIDGGASEIEAASVIVANGRHYGGAFVCAPRAGLDTGRLDACVFGEGGRRAAIKYGVALGLDLLPRLASVRQVPLATVAIEGPAGDPVQGDGDVITRLPCEIRLAPARLSILAPPGIESDDRQTPIR